MAHAPHFRGETNRPLRLSNQRIAFQRTGGGFPDGLGAVAVGTADREEVGRAFAVHSNRLQPRNRRAQASQGVRLVSVCSGVFLIARRGLLDGRTVSKHRQCARALVETHPQVVVDTEARMIDHIDILTAGGFMAWVDAGLILVERLLGGGVRAETARFIRSDPVASEAPHFAGVTPRHTPSDLSVSKAQEFIHMRDGPGVSLSSMAAAASLERRTLLRRFTSATELTPMEYCRAVRLARARELLETGNTPLQQIAASLGYADVSSFSRAFRPTLGVPPGVYRQQSVGSVAN